MQAPAATGTEAAEAFPAALKEELKKVVGEEVSNKLEPVITLNKQLIAENKQLMAENKQLVAENQQLKAAVNTQLRGDDATGRADSITTKRLLQLLAKRLGVAGEDGLGHGAQEVADRALELAR